MSIRREEIEDWLRETAHDRLVRLWERADATRRRQVGEAVHLRGLVEISNHCARQCAYCGLRAGRAGLARYRLTVDETLACARLATELGCGTLVLQAGEDPGLSADWVAEAIRRIKGETPLALTLSLGERDDAELALWRAAGADRYLLRFETSNLALYERLHPARPDRRADRIDILLRLRALGYEIGSGVMIGLPGQTWRDLTNDIARFAELDLDMIGVGPYLPHPDTPLGAEPGAAAVPGDGQVPNDELTTLKAIALARLACPRANIPSTTALATLDRRSGHELALERGANVVMPNLTPVGYRSRYEIYPDKECCHEEPASSVARVRRRVEALGRHVGSGPGSARERSGAVVATKGR